MHLSKKSIVIITTLTLATSFIIKTILDIKPVSRSFHSLISDAQMLQVTDRNGYPLTISYKNRWNTYDNLALYQIPELLKQAFLSSEDQDFFQHQGIDWSARFAALYQNLLQHHHLRGASTISEQVVRMLDPQPRNLWSKWIEGFEAQALEKHYSKAAIFEFYLNQIPYAANRRGVVQAAHYYFNRDLSTLSAKETLALVVLARAPSSYDLYKNPGKIDRAIYRLAQTLYQHQLLSKTQLTSIQQQKFDLAEPAVPVNASHFVNYVRQHLPASYSLNSIHTTLDANLQAQLQMILDQRLASLRERNVHNAATLVVDHRRHEIIAWVVAGANSTALKPSVPAYQIDAVTSPRQPGSALKPFLYSAALSKDWTAATLLDDSPYATAIGSGMHHFKNYSHHFYGKISLREALGNSLNIPALETIHYVGSKNYLDILHQLGFSSLTRSHNIYDEGLALGNGEVSLFELVQAYSTLANHGNFHALTFLTNFADPSPARKIFSAEVSSLIANILSDPWARHLEFGNNSVLNLPVQTAVKTGTSSDYHDAWALGFNYRYTIGIWMGNLDHQPMDGVTGALGPALVLRSSFAAVNGQQSTQPLFLSPRLVRQDICNQTTNGTDCQLRSEYFINGQSLPTAPALKNQPHFLLPTPGLEIAYDPRIPPALQQLNFAIADTNPGDKITWLLNKQPLATTTVPSWQWPLKRGHYQLQAKIETTTGQFIELAATAFLVK